MVRLSLSLSLSPLPPPPSSNTCCSFIPMNEFCVRVSKFVTDTGDTDEWVLGALYTIHDVRHLLAAISQRLALVSSCERRVFFVFFLFVLSVSASRDLADVIITVC